MKRKQELATKCSHTDRPRYGTLDTCKLCFYKHPSRARATTCEHTDRPVFARGLCRNCYARFARTNPARPRAWKCPHTDEAAYAKGYCQRCDHLRRKYGLRGSALRVVVRTERCGICRVKFSKRVLRHVDHCHTSGRVRGVLCGNCNRGLGCFQDSSKVLRAAAAYLRAEALEAQREIMADTPRWARGLPIRLDGFHAVRYRK